MATKHAYQQKLAAQLTLWDARVTHLHARMQLASVDARMKWKTELETLRVQREAVQGMLAELGRRGEHTWTDVRLGAEHAWSEMNKVMDRMKTHFR